MSAVVRMLPRYWDGHSLLRFLAGLAMLALAFTSTVPAHSPAPETAEVTATAHVAPPLTPTPPAPAAPAFAATRIIAAAPARAAVRVPAAVPARAAVRVPAAAPARAAVAVRAAPARAAVPAGQASELVAGHAQAAPAVRRPAHGPTGPASAIVPASITVGEPPAAGIVVTVAFPPTAAPGVRGERAPPAA